MSLHPDFISLAHSLQSLGINNVAWNYENILKVIEYVTNHGCVILGGDVYRIENGVCEITYDSWYVEDASISKNSVINESKLKVLTYIENYHRRNGDNFLYALVLEE